jgi:pimeloyl-ACP methyl ester carboxylesterase
VRRVEEANQRACGRVTAADGTSLHVESAGSGEPVIMVHGLGYAAWAAEPLRSRLAQSKRFVTFDNRGSGQSDKPPGPYTIRLLAEDAAAVARSLDEPSHVIGYSMGGYIALTLALRHPELVRSLLLIATSAGGTEASDVPADTRAAWAAAAGSPPAEFARRTMPLSFRPGWTDEHPEAFEQVLAARLAHPTPTAAWQAQYEASASYLATGVHADQIRVPTLVAHGTADRVVPFANAEVLTATIPGARLACLPGAGHLCWFEQPDTVGDLILDFLRHQEAEPGNKRRNRT